MTLTSRTGFFCLIRAKIVASCSAHTCLVVGYHSCLLKNQIPSDVTASSISSSSSSGGGEIKDDIKGDVRPNSSSEFLVSGLSGATAVDVQPPSAEHGGSYTTLLVIGKSQMTQRDTRDAPRLYNAELQRYWPIGHFAVMN